MNEVPLYIEPLVSNIIDKKGKKRINLRKNFIGNQRITLVLSAELEKYCNLKVFYKKNNFNLIFII